MSRTAFYYFKILLFLLVKISRQLANSVALENCCENSVSKCRLVNMCWDMAWTLDSGGHCWYDVVWIVRRSVYADRDAWSKAAEAVCVQHGAGRMSRGVNNTKQCLGRRGQVRYWHVLNICLWVVRWWHCGPYKVTVNAGTSDHLWQYTTSAYNQAT